MLGTDKNVNSAIFYLFIIHVQYFFVGFEMLTKKFIFFTSPKIRYFVK